MKQAPTLQLSDRHARTVAAILAAHEGRIGPVKVYGSRATGRARPGSDLDLVVFPPASESELTKLWLAFEESDLPITVELVAWERIASPRFRAEIEEHAIPFS